MGIILDNLPRPPAAQQIFSIGGLIPNQSLGLIKDYNAKFISNNGWFELFGENLLVIKEDHGYKLPSVWGVDFLARHSFKLILDHGKNFVELGN